MDIFFCRFASVRIRVATVSKTRYLAMYPTCGSRQTDDHTTTCGVKRHAHVLTARSIEGRRLLEDAAFFCGQHVLEQALVLDELGCEREGMMSKTTNGNERDADAGHVPWPSDRITTITVVGKVAGLLKNTAGEGLACTA